jgi:hypothetical protein
MSNILEVLSYQKSPRLPSQMVGHSLPGDRLRSHNLVECCMSGCAVCVHDLYQESLDDYDASVAAVCASLTDMNVPEDEWPETIRPGAEKEIYLPGSNPSLSAFREMERGLKARREAQAQS